MKHRTFQSGRNTNMKYFLYKIPFKPHLSYFSYAYLIQFIHLLLHWSIYFKTWLAFIEQRKEYCGCNRAGNKCRNSNTLYSAFKPNSIIAFPLIFIMFTRIEVNIETFELPGL